jgi:hypothetical protein
MVFTSLRKQRTNNFSPATNYFGGQEYAGPEQKRREKQRLKNGDLGFGLLDGADGNKDNDDDASVAFEPLNVHELQQSIHSANTRQSNYSKTSSSSGEKYNDWNQLPLSLQQELDDFGSLLNRHANLSSGTEFSNSIDPYLTSKPPSKRKSEKKGKNLTNSFPSKSLNPSANDSHSVNSSFHRKRNQSNAASHSNEYISPNKNTVRQNSTPNLFSSSKQQQNHNTSIERSILLQPKEAIDTSFFDDDTGNRTDHGTYRYTENNSSTQPQLPSGSWSGDMKRRSKPKPQASKTRRGLKSKSSKGCLSTSQQQSDDDQTTDSFFDDPVTLKAMPSSGNQRSGSEHSYQPNSSPPRCRPGAPFNISQINPSSPPGPGIRSSNHQQHVPPTPVSAATAKNYLALVHGDWNSFEKDPIMKSPDGKVRRPIKKKKKDGQKVDLGNMYLTDDSASSDDDSTSSRNTRDGGFVSEDEFEVEIDSSDDDDESVEKQVHGQTMTDDENDAATDFRRQVSRMTSGQLRRWDGFNNEVIDLIKIAMPDNLNKVSILMKQFAGREAELIQTLQTMCRRQESTPSCKKKQSIHHSRGAISNTSIRSPRRISVIAGRKIDAIARIAAASTLDDQTKAVKPEYVVDDENQSFWQSRSTMNVTLYSDDDTEDYDNYDEHSQEDEVDYHSSFSDDDNDDDDENESYEDDDDEEEASYFDDVEYESGENENPSEGSSE